MTKIAIIKNGPGIRQYKMLDNEWKDNSIELIWEINELRKKYQVVLVSLTDSLKDETFTDSQITLYDIALFHKCILKSYFHFFLYPFKTLRIIVKEKINYLIISNFRFIVIFCLCAKILNYKIVLNFSRGEQINHFLIFLIKVLKIKSIIAPGLMANSLQTILHIDVHMRLPNYPEKFYTDIEVAEDQENKFTVGFVGRLIPKKGIYTFLEAAITLAKQNAEFSFLIIGAGPEYDKLIRIVSENDLLHRILLIGEKTNIEVGTYLRRCHVLVMPTYTEGFSKTWIEAIITETPIVLTRVSGVDKLIIENVHGLYIRQGSGEDIVAKITYLYENQTLLDNMKSNLKELKSSAFLRDSDTFYDNVCNIVESSRNAVG